MYSWNLVCFRTLFYKTPAWHRFVIHTVLTVSVLDSYGSSQETNWSFLNMVSMKLLRTQKSHLVGQASIWVRARIHDEGHSLPFSFSGCSLPQDYLCQANSSNISVSFIFTIEGICLLTAVNWIILHLVTLFWNRYFLSQGLCFRHPFAVIYNYNP